MNIFAFCILLIITLYTFGFAVTLWEGEAERRSNSGHLPFTSYHHTAILFNL